MDATDEDPLKHQSNEGKWGSQEVHTKVGSQFGFRIVAVAELSRKARSTHEKRTYLKSTL